MSGRTTSSPSPDLLVLWQRSLTTLFVGKGPQSTRVTVLSWKGPFENAALPHFYFEGWAQSEAGMPCRASGFQRAAAAWKKTPEQMWKAMGQIIHWLLSEGFTGLP